MAPQLLQWMMESVVYLPYNNRPLMVGFKLSCGADVIVRRADCGSQFLRLAWVLDLPAILLVPLYLGFCSFYASAYPASNLTVSYIDGVHLCFRGLSSGSLVSKQTNRSNNNNRIYSRLLLFWLESVWLAICTHCNTLQRTVKHTTRE